MGLRDRDLDGPRFQMREKLMSVGDDFWIEDDQGHRLFKVNGKATVLRTSVSKQNITEKQYQRRLDTARAPSRRGTTAVSARHQRRLDTARAPSRRV